MLEWTCCTEITEEDHCTTSSRRFAAHARYAAHSVREGVQLPRLENAASRSTPKEWRYETKLKVDCGFRNVYSNVQISMIVVETAVTERIQRGP